MPIQQMLIGSETMKVLVCASARAEVVMKCLRELHQTAEITVIAPASVAAGLTEVPKNARLFRLKGPSFGDGPGNELDILKDICFDAVVIVSGGFGFTGFQNVVKVIAGLRFRQMIFYNQIGRRETVRICVGAGRTWERLTVSTLIGLFKVTRPVELLIERTYIQCAELLGL